jgi:hypothetical protein
LNRFREGPAGPAIKQQEDEPMNFTWHSDAGHSWLAVPMALLSTLTVEISNCSYTDGFTAYLEEDCDAPAFLRTIRGHYTLSQEPLSFSETYDGTDSPIRGMRRFINPNMREAALPVVTGSPWLKASAKAMENFKAVAGTWRDCGSYMPDHGCTED